MKLRLRSLESKQTLKIETPNPCTLPQLKQILSQTIPNSPSPDSIRLSLNRKDELRSDGEEDSLHSLGVAAGDLIFFSVGTSSNSPNTPLPEPDSRTPTSSNTQNTLPDADTLNPVISEDTLKGETEDMEVVGEGNTQNTLQVAHCSNLNSVNLDSEKGKSVDTGLEMEESVDDDMEVSYNDEGLLLAGMVEKSFSVPGFLRKVFMEELGDDTGHHHHKMIVIAVHSVMLESGFVGFDKNENLVVNGFHLRGEWPSGFFKVSLFYTLRESTKVAAIKSVVLKFQSLGKFINVYGTLVDGSGKKKETYRVQLNEDQLVPYLNVVWANCGLTENISGQNGDFSCTSPEKEVFKFWRNVKDNLALPLMIDLCEESGFELPPCFTRLPTDLKMKILEMLPGVDVAKTSCVCSELRYLGSSDELWKMKFEEEFGNERKEALGSWKKAFVVVWEMRSRKLASGARDRSRAHFWLPQPRGRRNFYPFYGPRVPRIIGGEYDIAPFGGDDLSGNNNPRRNFSPTCNLGARGVRFV